ncbi:hypothetical protein [Aliarcobacter butzleri]|uniref:hypothetical protein n=1 Tax=Aliarcobacter butzleri TaxID=28197 RepID=UPI002B23F70E|nr:hypothetical protein [Aliarcobacter butzleri]
MYITPAIPESGSIKLDNNLIKKAEKVVLKSAKLTGGHNKQFILAIKDLLKITNSYYSNLIESEGTHPFAKLLIEERLNGKISVTNNDAGAVFTITL